MPGLSQLRKLSQDVLKLGNEAKLRADRGEAPVLAKIPADIPDIDDSQDFVLGMPEKEVPPEEEQPVQEEETVDAEPEVQPAQEQEQLDLTSILNPMASMEENQDMPDLTSFLEPEPQIKSEPKPKDITELSLDDLLAAPSEDFSQPQDFDNEPETELEELEPQSVPEPQEVTVPAQEPVSDPNAPDAVPDIEALLASSAPDSDVNAQPSGDLHEDSSFATDAQTLDDLGSFDLQDSAQEQFTSGEITSQENPEPEAESEDEFAFSGEGINLNDDLPDYLNEVDAPESTSPVQEETSDIAESPVLDETSGIARNTLEGDDLSMLSDDFTDGVSIDQSEQDFSMPADDLSPSAADFGTENLSDFETESSSDAAVSDMPPSAGDFGFDAFDTTGLDDIGSNGFSENSGMDEQQPEPEIFDTSEMDGVDFSSPQAGDFNFADTDSQLSEAANDFGLDGDPGSEMEFEIPGFSDADANPFDAHGRVKAQKEEPPADIRQRNSLTDAEFKIFKKNLATYPLNVRIAVEDMIVKNEFTDDAIFELIEKVLHKVPARQLASYLEKMLDIQLSVPRDFERRTAEEYEAYKASFEYQLKNRIIPAVILGTLAFILLCCTAFLTNRFVVEPLKAEKHYRQGYALLQNDEYPQSEIEFNKALDHKQKKKWFFKYAEGYREHKQYDRAELMYKNILRCFNHDKKGGLDYVRMELEDLANYEKAETVIRREVLDYHINDKDALLLLGDIYLEWATEEDYLKFEQAFEQYSALMQLYGVTDEYLARMMRYYVRTDNLREVLQLKEGFMPNEKSLSGRDWTEISGYLMDKLYGELAPSEEYLRSSIEDVKQMLLRATKLSRDDPIAYYNLSRYFIETNDRVKAVSGLTHTIDLFKKASTLKKRDSYKELNSYRLLGEQYICDREYILASDTFAKGIELFEDKNKISGLKSDKNVGIMYADMGDINYFISGQLDAAYVNYTNAVMNCYDTSSLRYRLGYIDYGRNNFDSAINNFIIASQNKDQDKNLMLALGNAFSLRNDDYTGIGYYERLIEKLNREIEKHDVLFPQVKPEHEIIVDQYLKANNNIAVSKYRIARLRGDSIMNAQAIVNLQEALRAWDALTRDQKTLVRLGGTNLPEQNIKYMTHPIPEFEPAVFTEIPRILENEKVLE